MKYIITNKINTKQINLLINNGGNIILSILKLLKNYRDYHKRFALILLNEIILKINDSQMLY